MIKSYIFVAWNSSEVNTVDCFRALPSTNAQNSTNNAVPKMHSHLLLFVAGKWLAWNSVDLYGA